MTIPNKFTSRKLIAVAVGAILITLFPESYEGIVILIGTYLGANVAQKFADTSSSVKSVKSDLDEMKEILMSTR